MFEGGSWAVAVASVRIRTGVLVSLQLTTNVDWLLWTVSTKDDWNRYAHLTGSNTWSWKNVHRLLRKIERFVAPTEPNMVNVFVSCMILVLA
jgi:hypothetical protein